MALCVDYELDLCFRWTKYSDDSTPYQTKIGLFVTERLFDTM